MAQSVRTRGGTGQAGGFLKISSMLVDALRAASGEVGPSPYYSRRQDTCGLAVRNDGIIGSRRPIVERRPR